MPRYVSALLLGIFFAIPAGATEWFVHCDTGNDGGAGSSGDPYKTIAFALTQVAAAGDIVTVQNSECPEDLTIPAVNGTDGNPITLRALNKHLAVLQGGDLVSLSACASAGDCFNNANWANLFKGVVAADLDVNDVHLTEDGEPLQPAASATTTATSRMYVKSGGMTGIESGDDGSCSTLTALALTGGDGFFIGADMRIWSHALANTISRYTVTGWVDSTKTITFSPALTPPNCLEYDANPGLKDAFLIQKHHSFIDAAGDYAFIDTGASETTILVWPDADETKIRYAVRDRAIDVASDWWVIDGFKVTGYKATDEAIDIDTQDGVVIQNVLLVANNGHSIVYHNAEDMQNLYNTVRDVDGRGIGIFSSNNGLHVGNSIDNTGHDSMAIQGVTPSTHHVVAGNFFGRAGQHANGSTAYQGAKEILWVDNRFIEGNNSMTTNATSGDLWWFRNVFHGNKEGGNTPTVAFWGGGLVDALALYNNSITRVTEAASQGGLSARDNPGASPNEWVNNYIIGSCSFDDPAVRDFNAWDPSQYCWEQLDCCRGWALNANEIEIDTLTDAFQGYPTDFQPKGSMIGAGTSVFSSLPISTFPEFYFGTDCATWDIGPYTCGFGPEVGTSPTVTYVLPAAPAAGSEGRLNGVSVSGGAMQ